MNRLDGEGSHIYENGEYFKGTWKRGLKVGFGIFNNVEGTYVGEFKNDKKDGNGT